MFTLVAPSFNGREPYGRAVASLKQGVINIL
jgi:hypothetical protein